DAINNFSNIFILNPFKFIDIVYFKIHYYKKPRHLS
ncbi:MAG: hypothetical protein ACI81I_001009, partial [Arcobacteraceae bacterium]